MKSVKLAFFLFSLLAAIRPSRAESPPDAVVLAAANEPLHATLVAAAERVGRPPVLLYTPSAAEEIADYLRRLENGRDNNSKKNVWLHDPQAAAPAKWREQFVEPIASGEFAPASAVRRLYRSATTAVVVEQTHTELLLAATLLAGVAERPLVVLGVTESERTAAWETLKQLQPRELIAVGEFTDLESLANRLEAKVTRRATTKDTLAAYEKALGSKPLRHLVVLPTRNATPANGNGTPVMPAATYALQHKAAVVWVDPMKDVDEQLQELLERRYPAARYVTLWGSIAELPDETVPDPVTVAGLSTKLKENTITVPPLNALSRNKPCEYRVGRITGDSPATVTLLVARLQRPLRPAGEPRAVILANSDWSLPLLEMIVRSTAQTLDSRGWRTNAFYGRDVCSYRDTTGLWGGDLFLYEGHTAEMTGNVHFDPIHDHVHPGLYMFQGCRSLRQPEVAAWLRNGATGVVGTTTLTYSASGGAFAKAYVDAMLLDRMDAGTSLMVARNFMLALANMKHKRGHEQFPKILRAGMTFCLWGDPTWKPPTTDVFPPESERVRASRRGDVIELHVPEALPSPVSVEQYAAQTPLGAKLAGMYEWDDEDRTRRQLPPLYFVVVPLPDQTEAPKLRSPLAGNRWESLWDARNRWLYLLVQSGGKFDSDLGRRLTFRIEPAARPQ